MEKFKAVVSRIEIPDDIAIDALRNTLWVRSKFREDLYQNPTTSLQDEIARSDNFIRMEEDTNAILSKMNAPKAPAAKNANTRQEPRQHTPSDKNGLRGEGWNKWVRELDSSDKPVDTSKNKERRAKRKATDKGRQNETQKDGDKTPKYDGEEDSSADEEHPANRRRIEVILSQQTLSSDDDNDDTPKLGDLRDVLKRKLESKDDNSSKHSDLRLTLDAKKSRRISTDDLDPKEHQECSNGDLRDKLNAGACDLRILLNRSKPTDLRRRLEQAKTSSNATLSKNDNNVSADLCAFIDSKRVKTRQQLNVIMGGSPPCGNSVRSVKDYCRQVATSQRWPIRPPSHPPITFLPDDAEGIHIPHNDPLLVVLGIGEYDVTKVLIDTESSVDLIFRGTLQKMGVDLDNIKPSSRTLTGFNGSSETILGTIRLSVRACGVTRTVKFAVVSTKAPYHAILGTPWIHSMQAIPSTYHQCIKFPGTNSKIKTLRGDQKAARELLVATVKLQHSSLYPLTLSLLRPQRSKAVNEEVDRLLGAGSIAEVCYPEWLANPVVVKKKNGKWRICVDFTDLNKACPKDSYPLPNIDRLVESTTRDEMLTFMDAFSGYNQIMMHPDDREKTAFITDRGTYCYKVMPFGLKNA
ncbi:PREDICTED: uncharacterized protein LOC106333073 [Brassica oleracea var. oleracea]|uniref:uncharacterized protein LOC106333073 n=1 Tax=Brassica oleracea var. oleracea TaxID=109376 RepID=UPI0006A6AA64|nr:PREDICTED: uncharacterized protein LOC106333073 [Brassica oleracea var. oleracea]